MKKNKEIKIIPKKIHLIWFGSVFSEEHKTNIFKNHANGYEIKVWGEEDFDWDVLCKIPYIKKARENKEWAFLSDYLRLKIIYENGGIYFDCDMELVKDISNLIVEKNLILAFENNTSLSMGFFAATKGNDFILELLKIYNSYELEENIMGNLIWNFIGKKIGLKLNGKFQEMDDIVIFDYRKISLYNESKKKKIMNNQWIIHKHTLTWIPKKYRHITKMVIIVSQKIPIINKMFPIVTYRYNKKIRKNFDFIKTKEN